MSRKSWIQTEKGLIPKDEYYGEARSTPSIVGDIEPFVSPVTGRIIRSRSDLREHNREHGVTDSRDYSQSFLQQRSKERIAEMTGQTPKAQQERIELIRRTMGE